MVLVFSDFPPVAMLVISFTARLCSSRSLRDSVLLMAWSGQCQQVDFVSFINFSNAWFREKLLQRFPQQFPPAMLANNHHYRQRAAIEFVVSQLVKPLDEDIQFPNLVRVKVHSFCLVKVVV